MMMKKKWVWMLLTLLTSVGEWYGHCCGCLEEERIGLLEIKALIDPNSVQGELSDWMDNKEDIGNCCEWSGIVCENTTRRVIKLSLMRARDYRLGDWVLNASLFLPFKELQSLDLGETGLVGCSENEGWFNVYLLIIIKQMYINEVFNVNYFPLRFLLQASEPYHQN
jgi:hypothetical protein